jgi:site-specific DNA-methyltransferase (adenine-specific)
MINFFNVDCIEFMKSKPDKCYDIAIVDPPYGIDIAKWDTKEHKPKPEYWQELFRISKNQIVWGGNYFNLPHTEAWICWDKTYKYNQKLQVSEFELAWTSYEHKAKFLRFTYCGNFYGWEKPQANYDKPKNIHITQKPVDVYRWLLKEYATNGDKILDTHGGSMSSAIACDMEGFDLDICEIDKDYFEAGVKRFENYKRQGVLFAPEQVKHEQSKLKL